MFLVLAALLALPGVASAHAAGLTTTQSVPRVLGIDPAVPGISVAVVEYGARLRLHNGTTYTVDVEQPPGSIVPLPSVAPGATAYWADPRIAALARQSRPAGGVIGWQIPLVLNGSERVVVRGEQVWPEPPAAALWWAITLAVALAAALPVLLARGRRFGQVWLAVATIVVVTAHVIHIAGSAAVVEDQPYPLVFLAAAGFGLAAWPIGIAGAWLTLRGSSTGPLLCCITGALLALVVASTDVLTFHDAVVPFAWGADLDRLLISLAVGGGLGVAAAGIVTLRRTVPA
jgi:hypothetical protein